MEVAGGIILIVGAVKVTFSTFKLHYNSKEADQQLVKIKKLLKETREL